MSISYDRTQPALLLIQEHDHRLVARPRPPASPSQHSEEKDKIGESEAGNILVDSEKEVSVETVARGRAACSSRLTAPDSSVIILRETKKK